MEVIPSLSPYHQDMMQCHLWKAFILFVIAVVLSNFNAVMLMNKYHVSFVQRWLKVQTSEVKRAKLCSLPLMSLPTGAAASSQAAKCTSTTSLKPEQTLAQRAAKQVIKGEPTAPPQPEVIMIVDPEYTRAWKRMVLWVFWAYRQGAAQAMSAMMVSLVSWNQERQALSDVWVKVETNRMSISREAIILRAPLRPGNPSGLKKYLPTQDQCPHLRGFHQRGNARGHWVSCKTCEGRWPRDPQEYYQAP
eukprot:5422302-Amphidinium_carterae.1